MNLNTFLVQKRDEAGRALGQLDIKKLKEMGFDVGEDDRLVLSWASVEMVDKQGEIIDVDELLESRKDLGGSSLMQIMMKMGGTTMNMHQAQPMGKILGYTKAVHPETGKEGLLVLRKIYDYLPSHHEIWNEVKSGRRLGMSIGGTASGKRLVFDKSDMRNFAKQVSMREMFEISDVDKPANPGSYNIAANLVAKSDSTGLQKGDLLSIEEAIEKQQNPWAICTETVGREDKDRFERCVMHVKERLGIQKTLSAAPGKAALARTSSPEDEEDKKEGREQASDSYKGFKFDKDDSIIKDFTGEKMSEQVPKQEQGSEQKPDEKDKLREEMEKLKKSVAALQKRIDDSEGEKKPEKEAEEKQAEEKPKPEEKPKEELKNLVKQTESPSPESGKKEKLPKSAGDKSQDPSPQSAGENPKDKVTITEKQMTEMVENIKKSVEADIRRDLGVVTTPRPSLVMKSDGKYSEADSTDVALKVAKGEQSFSYLDAHLNEQNQRMDRIAKVLGPGGM